MSDSLVSAPGRAGVECIIPILPVHNVQSSIRFYTEVLGFTVDWGGEEGSGMASVSRNGHAIMFCQGDQEQSRTLIWIGVEDIEPLFEQWRARGVTFRQTPVNYPWAHEMEVQDPDGHVLRVGSEPRTDQPFEDE
jgi:uncharacterized glyoxalase superfamily protein PhnB